MFFKNLWWQITLHNIENIYPDQIPLWFLIYIIFLLF
jgi:hypothetical protein